VAVIAAGAEVEQELSGLGELVEQQQHTRCRPTYSQLRIALLCGQ
jgi:hypothetical protein